MIIGMFTRALCCALWAGNVSLRGSPTSKRRLLQGLVGLAARGVSAFSFFFPVRAAVRSRPFTPLKAGATASAPAQRRSLARRAHAYSEKPRRVRRCLAALFAARRWRGIAGAGHGLPLFRPAVRRPGSSARQIPLASQRRTDLWTHRPDPRRLRHPAGTGGRLALHSSAAIRLGVARMIFWIRPECDHRQAFSRSGIILAGGCETGWMAPSMEARCTSGWSASATSSGGTPGGDLWNQLGTRLPPIPLNLLESFGPRQRPARRPSLTWP
ncbi:hypothetical protein ACPA9J_33100 [Pseudomonas aeruginosa]